MSGKYAIFQWDLWKKRVVQLLNDSKECEEKELFSQTFYKDKNHTDIQTRHISKQKLQSRSLINTAAKLPNNTSNQI